MLSGALRSPSMSSEKAMSRVMTVSPVKHAEGVAHHGRARDFAESADMRQARRAVAGLEEHIGLGRRARAARSACALPRTARTWRPRRPRVTGAMLDPVGMAGLSRPESGHYSVIEGGELKSARASGVAPLAIRATLLRNAAFPRKGEGERAHRSVARATPAPSPAPGGAARRRPAGPRRSRLRGAAPRPASARPRPRPGACPCRRGSAAPARASAGGSG